jgi:hypothetical protein
MFDDGDDNAGARLNMLFPNLGELLRCALHMLCLAYGVGLGFEGVPVPFMGVLS